MIMDIDTTILTAITLASVFSFVNCVLAVAFYCVLHFRLEATHDALELLVNRSRENLANSAFLHRQMLRIEANQLRLVDMLEKLPPNDGGPTTQIVRAAMLNAYEATRLAEKRTHALVSVSEPL